MKLGQLSCWITVGGMCLSEFGVEIDEERLTKFLSEVEGKSIDELIATGAGKLSSVSVASTRHRRCLGFLWGFPTRPG